jgi:hypothetical protein
VQQNWFRSKFFYIWVVGSVCAIIFMPVITAVSRDDPLKVSIFLAFQVKAFGDLVFTSAKPGLSSRAVWAA